jgi:alpha-tubulin suppressor-like RCC1 family protein
MSTRRRLVLLLLPGLALGAPACRQDPVSPGGLEGTTPSDNAVTAAAALVFRSVSPGMRAHTCGVTTTDKAYCWGNNGFGDDYGPLGDGTDVVLRLRPVAVVGGLSFRRVSAGWGHTCGVTTNDRAYCWGLNTDGALGDGTNASTNRPVAVAGGLRFRVVETGAFHTCGLTTAGQAYCWGNNTFGHLGDGTTTRRNVPVAVLGGHTFIQISASWEHTCAVKASGEAWCWGANRFGQLGIGGTTGRKQRPALVVGGHLFAQISAGGMQQRGTTCAVTTGNKAYCWGDGSLGQRGDNTTGGALGSPRAVAGSQLFSRIAVGFDHTCAVNTNSRAWCWGHNFFGGLGDGTTTQRLKPMRVLGTLAFAQLSTGSAWTCGTTTAGAGYCWGSNIDGTVGDGTGEDRHVPTAVVGPM